jgi:hypothetical protein
VTLTEASQRVVAYALLVEVPKVAAVANSSN